MFFYYLSMKKTWQTVDVLGWLLNSQVRCKVPVVVFDKNTLILMCRKDLLLKSQVWKERINEGRLKAKKVSDTEKLVSTVYVVSHNFF